MSNWCAKEKETISTIRKGKKKDVFGKALMGHLNGDSSSGVILRDDGFKEEMDIKSYFNDYSSWNNSEKEVLKYAQGKILDIGAGAGKHALYLQKKEFKVYPIDISPLAVAVMKKRGIKNVRLMDLMELEIPKNNFDTILMMFNVLGLGKTVENIKKILRCLYDISTPNGRIIATITNPYKTNNPSHISYHMRNRKVGKPAGLVKIRVKYKGENGDWFYQLLFSPTELRALIKNTGWSILSTVEEDAIYGAVLKKLHKLK